MFSKLSALLVLAPLASALTITTPTNWTSGGPAVIEWTTADGDPSTWSFELVNPDNFHATFGIANNVNPATGSMSLELPSVPEGDGYSLEAVNITNINQVFASTGDFAIGAPVSVSSTASSTSASASSSSSVSGASAANVTATSPTSGASAGSTGFGITVSSSGSAAAATGSGSSANSGASSGSGTSSSSGSTPSSFNGSGNSGAVSNSIASWMSALFAAAAAAVVAL